MNEDERIAKPLTNGDRLRAMSNEELAEIITKGNDCNYCLVHDFCEKTFYRLSCKDAWLAWLNSPAESEVNHE